jgi:hypothetical protein
MFGFISALAPQSRDILEKLTVAQLDKKFPAFYGTQRSLPYSQEPATGNSEPDESRPHTPILFL